MGKNLAAGTQYVPRVSKEGSEAGESMTGKVSHPSKTITGRCFNACLCVRDRFPVEGFKAFTLTGSGEAAPR